MGKYCTAAAAAVEGEQPVMVSVPPPLTRYLYGDYVRCSIKQVFDNLHDNISLDPVTYSIAPLILSSSSPSLRVALARPSYSYFVAAARLTGLIDWVWSGGLGEQSICLGLAGD